MSYTVDELKQAGLIINQHMWLSTGFLYCRKCRDYYRHYAMSEPGIPGSCFEICINCQNYSGNHQVAKIEETRIANTKGGTSVKS